MKFTSLATTIMIARGASSAKLSSGLKDVLKKVEALEAKLDFVEDGKIEDVDEVLEVLNESETEQYLAGLEYQKRESSEAFDLDSDILSRSGDTEYKSDIPGPCAEHINFTDECRVCPTGYEYVTNEDECLGITEFEGKEIRHSITTESLFWQPCYIYHKFGSITFNTKETKLYLDHRGVSGICKKQVETCVTSDDCIGDERYCNGGICADTSEIQWTWSGPDEKCRDECANLSKTCVEIRTTTMDQLKERTVISDTSELAGGFVFNDPNGWKTGWGANPAAIFGEVTGKWTLSLGTVMPNCDRNAGHWEATPRKQLCACAP